MNEEFDKIKNLLQAEGIAKYKGFVIEISGNINPYRPVYRIYREGNPQDTIAYDDNLVEIVQRISEQ